MENTIGLMDLYIKDNGKMIRHVVLVDFFMLMETYILVSGLKIKLVEEVDIIMQMELFMMGSGNMICKRALELKLGRTALGSKVNIKTAKKMAKVSNYLKKRERSIQLDRWKYI